MDPAFAAVHLVPQPGPTSRAVALLQKQFSEAEKKKYGWEEAYGKICDAAITDVASKESRRSRNKLFNRYKNVVPYDHTRVILSDNTGTDYVNASWVEVPAVKRRYILSQGPLQETTGHFWLMIWQQGTLGVIMLNALVEKKIPKCFQYWPENVGETLVFDDVHIKVTLVEEYRDSFYIIRKLKVVKTDASPSSPSSRRVVSQFHYTTWPDFGSPKSPDEMLDFLVMVRAAGVLSEPSKPAVIHCSAGIGRSGTFCLVDACLLALAAGMDVDVKETLMGMRKYRMGLVQTADQYRFANLAIVKGIKDRRLVPPVQKGDRKKAGGGHRNGEIPGEVPDILEIREPGNTAEEAAENDVDVEKAEEALPETEKQEEEDVKGGEEEESDNNGKKEEDDLEEGKDKEEEGVEMETKPSDLKRPAVEVEEKGGEEGDELPAKHAKTLVVEDVVSD